MKIFHLLFIFYLVLPVASCTENQVSSRNYGNRLDLVYVVLYSHKTQVKAETTTRVQERLIIFSQTMTRETLGKMQITCTPLFINVHSLGLSGLNYQDHSFFEWMDCLLKTDELKSNFDVVTFTPVMNIPWANDSHSIGFYYKNCVCFSLEYYPYTEDDDVQAIALMIHKMFHGFGYNHQNINMPALKLLNWELGLPVNTGLEAELRNIEGYNAFFFDQHILNVLDSSRHETGDSLCLDCDGLVSQSSPWRKGLTAYAYGPHCYDADHDGIIDEQDDYFLSSPIKGEDADEDGIVDALDLVPWNYILVSGNIDAGKINLTAKDNKSIIEFTGDKVNIVEIKTIYLKQVPVQLKPDNFPGCFPKHDAVSTKGNRVALQKDMKKAPIVRVEVHYEYQNKRYYRPYYFYFPGTPVLQIISEREWYYFLRYGADVPKGIDFYHVNSYDKDYDGILDNNQYKYFNIPDEYDWDNDGFPDLKDTLPTVFGQFHNEFVSGVKDSDNDGLADPGCLDFSQPCSCISPYYYFGEFERIIGENYDYDRSPYLKGSIKSNGFPIAHFDF